ncbi:uncharacterized protein LOC126833729 [Adelges cooleyi]|uniref:uncharacterized protein LOC126833729 n=1 Tax=Adelges cooleyi TaxID=133065 RepID=UPI00217F6332|nr:uncharacterized protein LOC126833729 [Adelges cooleyi]
MTANKVLLVAVFVLVGSMYLSQVAGDADGEKLAKFLAVGIKCFNNIDLDVCSEMMNGEYDITQQKYKDCTCALACMGKDMGLIVDGKPVPGAYMKLVDQLENASVKAELTEIHEKCANPKGDDECAISENFMTCALKTSPKLKERMTTMMKAMSPGMKQ